MKYYVKALGLDCNRNLVSCHGGSQAWRIGEKVTPKEPDAGLCRAGRIHVLRKRNLAAWLGTHLAVVAVESPDVIEAEDKVGVLDATIVRVAPVDGLDVLVRFAEFCAAHSSYTAAAGAEFIAAQYPSSFFDGVEE